MPWIECKDHPSVYFDSSIHKNCPECQNEIFKEIVKLYSEIIDKDDEYDLAVLDLIQTYLTSFQYVNEGKWDEEKKRNFTSTCDSKAEDLKNMRMAIRKERSKVLNYWTGSRPRRIKCRQTWENRGMKSNA